MDETGLGLYPFLICVMIFHCCSFFFDTFFKSCLHLPYLSLLNNMGIEIKPFRIHWYTTAFNRIIQKWGSTRPKLLLAWFSAGSWVSMILMPLAVLLLVRSTYVFVKDLLVEDKLVFTSVGTLQPMVPGWNLPLSELGYYTITLLICTTFHELGHAIAAVREDGRVGGVGMVVLFCVPVAYVSLESLEVLSAVRRLRVMCAGVWHNLLLALAAAALTLILPYVLLPLYDWGKGVQVQDIQKDSPVYGIGGLMSRDLITNVNKCVITDLRSWQHCLIEAVRSPTPGYCLLSEFIKEHDESVPAKHLQLGTVECCNSNAPRHLCFEYLDSSEEPLQLPQFSCLNARTVVERVSVLCQHAQDCPDNHHCFRPSLENTTRLVSLTVQTGRVVLFLGHPAEIYQTVSVSDFTDLYTLFPTSIPERIQLLCNYIVSFSFGMALLNIIPCFYFDGQHIIRTMLDLYLSKHVEHSSVRHALSLCLTFIGTFILGLYLVVAFWYTIN